MVSVGDTRAATGVGLLREWSALRGNLRPLHVYTGVLTPPQPAAGPRGAWPSGRSGWLWSAASSIHLHPGPSVLLPGGTPISSRRPRRRPRRRPGGLPGAG